MLHGKSWGGGIKMFVGESKNSKMGDFCQLSQKVQSSGKSVTLNTFRSPNLKTPPPLFFTGRKLRPAGIGIEAPEFGDDVFTGLMTQPTVSWLYRNGTRNVSAKSITMPRTLVDEPHPLVL